MLLPLLFLLPASHTRHSPQTNTRRGKTHADARLQIRAETDVVDDGGQTQAVPVWAAAGS